MWRGSHGIPTPISIKIMPAKAMIHPPLFISCKLGSADYNPPPNCPYLNGQLSKMTWRNFVSWEEHRSPLSQGCPFFCFTMETAKAVPKCHGYGLPELYLISCLRLFTFTYSLFAVFATIKVFHRKLFGPKPTVQCKHSMFSHEFCACSPLNLSQVYS